MYNSLTMGDTQMRGSEYYEEEKDRRRNRREQKEQRDKRRWRDED